MPASDRSRPGPDEPQPDEPQSEEPQPVEQQQAAPSGRWIIHVDMDAFYASVEALDDPSLRGVPLIVGGTGSRGVVASCSYEARAFGVRSAMSSVAARRLCPQAVFVPGRFSRYGEVSRQMHAIFARFTPLVEGISLDEAFLDVSGALRLFGSPRRIGEAIRTAVSEELGLSCAVGAATVKFLAKLASEAAKPGVGGAPRRPGAETGVFVVEPGRELEFLHPLPIEALWGVGPATASRLRSFGLATVGELAALPLATLESAAGRAHGLHLWQLARGIDERPVEPDREVKSVSHEETYETDRRDLDGLKVEVLRMADAVATRMRRAGLVGRTVTLKLRYGDFSTRSRSATGPAAVSTAGRIAEMAGGLLDQFDLSPGVRLLGVGVTNLLPASESPGEQLSLDLTAPAPVGPAATPAPDGPPPGRPGSQVSPRRPAGPAKVSRSAAAEASARAVEAVRLRFGDRAVGPAALLGEGGLRVKRSGDTQWGPDAGGGHGAPERDSPGDGEPAGPTGTAAPV